MKMKPKMQTPGFDVADDWPFARAALKLRGKAVQALVANHTLIVGQSRSGKTNAARRIIEQILRWTDARVVILDPNADFKSLSELSPWPNSEHSDKDFDRRWPRMRKRIAVATPGEAWGIDWGKLTLADMAAFLRLTPTETFTEYRHLDRHYKFEMETKEQIGSLEEFKESRYFRIAVGEDVERYRLRIEELSRLNVWASNERKDLDSLFDENSKAIVVDLSMDEEQVRMITVARTLEALWRQGDRQRRELLRKSNVSGVGTLVVIDEGHLFAPPETEDSQRQLVSERIQRFADQGKKLNLYLMVITQQPGKLHPNVLSEFSNRIIMRVNERGSLTSLEKTYGGLRGRYDGALTFEPGEALLEGALLCDETPPPVVPRGVRFWKARTREGGGTPNANWALPHASS
jgi:DNA helicase HerA-like ATPase